MLVMKKSGSKNKSSHKAKSPWQWRQRLIKFVREGKFSRGEAPPKGSYWAKIVQEILECPAHGDSGVRCLRL